MDRYQIITSKSTYGGNDHEYLIQRKRPDEPGWQRLMRYVGEWPNRFQEPVWFKTKSEAKSYIRMQVDAELKNKLRDCLRAKFRRENPPEEYP